MLIRPSRAVLGIFAGLAMVAAVAGCGKAGSSGTKADSNVKGKGCAPVAGSQLMVLTDDKHLQNSDNVIPAINAKVYTPALAADLDKVSQALDTTKLVQLNKATDIDRKPPSDVAKDFISGNNLTDGIQKGSGSLTIGAANFSESQTLAYLYSNVLTAAGWTTKVQAVGNRELYEPALEKGTLSIVPEYAATLTEFLNTKANGASAAPMASPDITKTVAALATLGTKDNLKFGKASDATDENAFGVTTKFADKYGLKTLSDFAAKCSGKASVLGGPPECPKRPFCQEGLEKTYKIDFGKFVPLDAGGSQSKNGLKTGTVSLSLVFSSDASLASS